MRIMRKLKNIAPYYLDVWFSKRPARISIRNIVLYKLKPREYGLDIWINSDRVEYGSLLRAKNKVELEKEIKKYIKEEYGTKKKKKE